jgi:hypothetical protein
MTQIDYSSLIKASREMSVLARLILTYQNKKMRQPMLRVGKSTGIRAPVLHVFGDSHSRLFGATPGAISHHIGPVTMYRVGRDGISVFDLASRQINDGDAIGFCFGEIDIRVHFAKQIAQLSRTPREVVDSLVASYLTTLDAVRGMFPTSSIVVFSSVPPAGIKHPGFDAAFPRNGTDRNRAVWAKILNHALKREALRRRFWFVDQYTTNTDRRGLMALRQTADGIHLNLDPNHRFEFPIYMG